MTQPKRTFTKEQKEALINFARRLKEIHIRLVIEGYKIEDGKITPPEWKVKEMEEEKVRRGRKK